MVRKNIIVFGSNGMLGTYMKLYFQMRSDINLLCLTREDYDIKNLSRDSLRQCLLALHLPKEEKTIIVNCAGIVPQSVGSAEEHRSDFFLVNSLFPLALNHCAKKFGYKMIHITTDCVFTGNDDGYYTEEDEHLEHDLYGVSKSLGELCTATIIRTSIIGEEFGQKKSLLEFFLSHRNETVNGFSNHFWNGITCLQLVQIIEKIIMENYFWEGVRHIFSNKIYSKYEMAKLINEVYDLNLFLQKVEHWQTITRTLSTVYDTNAFFKIPPLKTQLCAQKEFSEKKLSNLENERSSFVDSSTTSPPCSEVSLQLTETSSPASSIDSSQTNASESISSVSIKSYSCSDLSKNVNKLAKKKKRNITIDLNNVSLIPKPFPHVVIDKCLEQSLALALQKEILEYPSKCWDRYDNPFEKKYTFNKKFSFGPHCSRLFSYLESNDFIMRLSTLFKVRLLRDEYRHYWGLHKYKHGDHLNIHVDAGIHPKCKLRKHVTIGIYLSKDWTEENQGHFQFWSGSNAAKNTAELYRCEKQILPELNRLVLFECTDFSWHGNPNPVQCKNGEMRIFLTMSYLTKEQKGDNKRERAFFVPRPGLTQSESTRNLRMIRADRNRYKQVYRTHI